MTPKSFPKPTLPANAGTPVTEFVRRLEPEIVMKIAAGELNGRLETGELFTSKQVTLWKDGKSVSMKAEVNGRRLNWPECGCGVKVRVRAEELGGS